LVHEAGGAMTDFDGRPPRYKAPHAAQSALIAAGPARHRVLLNLVRGHRGEFA
jgi:3'-phosphoadenosine 5'-phosphosulfate (PAPS) 3'-phosphatase